MVTTVANPFDEFDPAPAQQAGPVVAANPFDEFDSPPDDLAARNQSADAAMASIDGQKLAADLRTRADKILLKAAGAESPIYATLSNAANMATLNATRNIKAGIMSLQNDKPFEQEYNYIRDIDEAATRQSPIAAGIGTAAGIGSQIAMLPVAPAASIGGRIAQGAAIGAGASGAAEVLDTKDAATALRQAAIGGVLGAAAPAAIGGVIGAGGSIANKVRSVVSPGSEAERRVSLALARDAEAGGRQLDEAALRAAQDAGQPVVVADMGGETTKALARSAANTSPQAREALQRVANERFENQAPRVSEFVMGLGTGNEALATREALQIAAAKANRPAYDRAFAQGISGSWHEGLSQLAQAPVVSDAIKGATRTGANKAAAEGFRPVKNPFVELESGEIALRDSGVKPTLQFWDAVKRNLDDKIGSLQRSGEKSAARDAIELRRQLVEYMDQDFPAYKDARVGAASFFGAEDALEAGKKFATASGKNAEYMRAIEKMNPHERKLFADGFVSRMSQKIDETGDRRNVINSVFNSPASRRRVELALGPKRAKEFDTFMRVETTMNDLRNALGNSTTARQLVELGLAGGIGGGVGFMAGGGDYTHAAIGAIANLGRRRIDARIARRVGEMLVSNDPAKMQELARMASAKKPVRDFIKSIDARVGAFVGGVKSGSNIGAQDQTDESPAIMPERRQAPLFAAQ